MARKIKFALEMADGAKVRGSIEELREHFDLEKAVGYFLSGKLVEWLEDRFYEDEAEAVEAIDKDAPDLRERLCAALDVPYEGDSELDVAALERLNEKKAILRQKTGDEEIISHAAQTALNQEDLADLLEMDESVIYLCGEKFNIPARVKNKRYVGILGTPTISIKANSQEEVDAKGIVFENVNLPWGKKETVKNEETKPCPKCGADNAATAKFCNSCGASMDGPTGTAKESSAQTTEKVWRVPKKQLKALFAAMFTSNFESRDLDPEGNYTIFVDDHYEYDDRIIDTITDEQKAMALTLICNNMYDENDLIHLRISDDMTRGWALTLDSVCILGDESKIIPYKSLGEYSDEDIKALISVKKGSFDSEYYGYEGMMKYLSKMKLLFRSAQ